MKKKFFHLIVMIFAFAGLISAQVSQVVKDFEDPGKGTDGFLVSVGDIVTGLDQKIDSIFGGVLETQIKADTGGTATIEVDNFNQFWTSSSEGSQFLTVDVFVPKDFPDSSYIQLWEMDQTNWSWKQTLYSPSNLDGGRSMVKGAWNTFVFEIKREYQDDPEHFFPWNVRMGLEMKIYSKWTGSVLIDNLTLWATPKVLDDFAQDMNGWANWGDIFSSPPSWINHAQYGGVAQLTVANNTDSLIKGGISISNIVLGWTKTTVSAVIMSLDIYIPKSFPDSSFIQFYNMDQTHWNWKRTIYSPSTMFFGDNTTLLKKGIWNTIAFEVQQQYDVDSVSYNPWTQIQAGLEINIDTTYADTLYIDNFYLYSKDDLLQTGVFKDESLPLESYLAQNYPNPFNPTTLIQYQIARSNMVSLKVYDVLGREVAALVNEQKAPGNYKVTFNGSRLASGVYIYRLKAGNFVQTKKLLLLK